MQQLTPREHLGRIFHRGASWVTLKLTRRADIFNAFSAIELSDNDDEAVALPFSAAAKIPEISSRKSANGLSSSSLLLTSIENKHEAAADFTAGSYSLLREN